MIMSTSTFYPKPRETFSFLFILAVILSSFSPIVSSAPAPGADLKDVNRREALPPNIPRQLDLDQREVIPRGPGPVLKYTEDQNDLLRREAGLSWGPIYIGNLKLSLTNPHDGYAGPKFPSANHVNFHVDKKDDGPRGTYSEVVNMHIVKYTQGDSECLYAWDSVTKTTVFDSCFDDFSQAIEECVSAVKDFVDTLLQNADFIASIAIIGALVVALGAALASLGAVAVA